MSLDAHQALIGQWDLATCTYARDGERSLIDALGGVLRPGAGEPAVAELESRLGIRLPPSYRRFLLRSDGAHAMPSVGVTAELGFLDCASVAWLRDVDRVTLDIWGYEDQGLDPFSASVPERRYLDHEGGDLDSACVKRGHFRYVLQISAWDEACVFLLNPLVVDQHGEWEAWHFSPSYAGAVRWRSFAALLKYDIAQREQRPAVVAERAASAEQAASIALDCARTPDERLLAAVQVLYAGERERALPVLIELTGPAQTLEIRQGALSHLARHSDDARVLAAFVAVAHEAALPDRLQSSVITVLAGSKDAAARDAAHAILTRPGVQDFVLSFAGRAAGDALWRAWQAARDPRLIVQLAYAGDPRACAPLAELIVDPTVDAPVRERLSWYAAWPGDASVVPALVLAAERGLAAFDSLASALERLGAPDEALAVRVRGVREHDPFGNAARDIGWMRHPNATAALIELLGERPNRALARALGWSTSERAVTALSELAADPSLHPAAVDALEKMATPAALDHLAERCAHGDTLAARALARRRDPRAREHLLALLEQPATALNGADGLRDLRDPSTATTLLTHVGTDPDDLTVIAAHALVSMQVPEAKTALERLHAASNDELARLASSWKTP
jgi:hypothetical protein